MIDRSITLAAVLAIGFAALAHAQAPTHPPVGGTASTSASTGTSVKTGQGPLGQPIAPAASTIFTQPNQQGNAQRPLGATGAPAQTFPSPNPFGH